MNPMFLGIKSYACISLDETRTIIKLNIYLYHFVMLAMVEGFYNFRQIAGNKKNI